VQSKLLAAPVACPLSGSCDTVLSSGYAELFGVPLSAFGERLLCTIAQSERRILQKVPSSTVHHVPADLHV